VLVIFEISRSSELGKEVSFEMLGSICIVSVRAGESRESKS
jgi:hypothetical protein